MMSVAVVEARDYVGVRARLGMPVASRGHVRRDLLPVTRLKPVASYYAPFNFYAPCSAEAIIRLVAAARGFKYHDIIGTSRTRAAVAARREAVMLVTTHCRPMTLHQLGRIFHKNHATILNLLGRRKRNGKTAMVYPTINSTHTP